ncbi:DUF397 domain-containing protein [Nucisporomicrobium flavum]|uniref:DUF397 domain-containing protein n=1 Tax=Nucisporomicrobium flavum TaxID=2785915 RepID=UPI0018F471F3|nr:DUF397 domain-containing protein [Nucisporomicrobium flavum]
MRHHLDTAEFRKSSYSNGNGGSNCVEVALQGAGGVAVRDSKNPHDATLLFTAAEWDAFVAGVKDGEFDIAGNPSPGA